MTLAIVCHTAPLIETPCRHEARIHHADLRALGFMPFDSVILRTACASLPCRLVPEVNVQPNHLHLQASCHQALGGIGGGAIQVAIDTASMPGELRSVTFRELLNDRSSPWGQSEQRSTLLLQNTELSNTVKFSSRGLPLEQGCVVCCPVLCVERTFVVTKTTHVAVEGGDAAGVVTKSTCVIVAGDDDDASGGGGDEDSDSTHAGNDARSPPPGLKRSTTPFRNSLDQLHDIARLARLPTRHLFLQSSSSAAPSAAAVSVASSNGGVEGLLPKGALLFGPPGSGKTTCARLFADELKKTRTTLTPASPLSSSSSSSPSSSSLPSSSVRVVFLSALDLVLDSDPRAMLQRVKAATLRAHDDDGETGSDSNISGREDSSNNGAGREESQEAAAVTAVTLVVVDDLEVLLGGTGGDDGDDDSGGGDGGGAANERFALALIKSFLDELAAEPSGRRRHRVFVLGVCSSGSSGGSGGGGAGGGANSAGGGGAPGSREGLLRVGRLERAVCLEAPTREARADILLRLLRRLCEPANQQQLQQQQQQQQKQHQQQQQHLQVEGVSESNITSLVSRVARATPGFVAGDLVRLADAAGLNALDRFSRQHQHHHSPPSAPVPPTSFASAATAVPALAVEWVDFAAALAVVKPSALRDLDVQTMTSAGRNSGGGSAAAGGFGSFGGFEDLKARVRRSVIGPWAAPELHKALGVQPLSGALLHGPPGCGKTMLASAIAAECASAITMTMDTTTTTVTATAVAMTRTTPEVNGGGVGDDSGVGGGGGGDGVNFVHVRSTELLSKWLGESERLLRRLFARARGCPPCVLFFDDLDALVGKRALEGGGSGSGGGGLETRLLTTFLSEMDGVASGGGAGGVLVLAATQNINALDAALLRPGRLQESLFVGPPTSAEDRAAVLAVHTRPLPLAPLSAGGDNPAQVLGDVSGGGVGRGGDQVGGGRRGGCYGVSGGDDDQAAEDDDARLCTPNEKETAVQALVADLALRTHGFSCAELAALPRAAAKLALRRHLAEIESAVAGPAARRRKSAGLPPVTAKDFEAALSRVKQHQTSVVSAHLPSERKP